MNPAAKSRPSSILRQLALSAIGWSCASSLPGPPLAVHPAGAYAEVPYPPPAAMVEVVPPSPSSSLVWLDGYWTWQGQSYTWMRGGWVFVPAGEYFARWQTHYSREGVLMFATGIWYARDGSRLRPPEIQVSAYSPPNEATLEFQTAR
jgi:hypothetical protein